MNPTREQMRDWAKSAGIIPQIISDARIEDFAALAYTAGRDAGLEFAAAFANEFMEEQEGVNYGIGTYIRALKGEKE